MTIPTESPIGLTFARVAAQTAEFDSFYHIYEEALPFAERKDADALAIMCGSEDYKVFVGKHAREVLGFFIVFNGRTLSLLEYMAVRSSHRGLGIGSALYRRARAEASPAVPMLLEVDSESEPTPDRETRRRRKAFYRRLGCREIEGLVYILPLQRGPRPPLMNIMVDGAPAAIEKGTAAEWLREIYRRVYACAENDPRLLAMIASMPPDIRLV